MARPTHASRMQFSDLQWVPGAGLVTLHTDHVLTWKQFTQFGIYVIEFLTIFVVLVDSDFLVSYSVVVI